MLLWVTLLSFILFIKYIYLHVRRITILKHSYIWEFYKESNSQSPFNHYLKSTHCIRYLSTDDSTLHLLQYYYNYKMKIYFTINYT